mmetsp:Transcript_30851/g.108518  ORF Transcript_30851/g.108518 Transcript_30851/m.108518 type:complete len:212 (+) Transcript_30851:883-1518(+)
MVEPATTSGHCHLGTKLAARQAAGSALYANSAATRAGRGPRHCVSTGLTQPTAVYMRKSSAIARLPSDSPRSTLATAIVEDTAPTLRLSGTAMSVKFLSSHRADFGDAARGAASGRRVGEAPCSSGETTQPSSTASSQSACRASDSDCGSMRAQRRHAATGRVDRRLTEPPLARCERRSNAAASAVATARRPTRALPCQDTFAILPACTRP